MGCNCTGCTCGANDDFIEEGYVPLKLADLELTEEDPDIHDPALD